jgi:hypothetical protein
MKLDDFAVEAVAVSRTVQRPKQVPGAPAHQDVTEIFISFVPSTLGMTELEICNRIDDIADVIVEYDSAYNLIWAAPFETQEFVELAELLMTNHPKFRNHQQVWQINSLAAGGTWTEVKFKKEANES